MFWDKKYNFIKTKNGQIWMNKNLGAKDALLPNESVIHALTHGNAPGDKNSNVAEGGRLYT